jgi:hypothetical protein
LCTLCVNTFTFYKSHPSLSLILTLGITLLHRQGTFSSTPLLNLLCRHFSLYLCLRRLLKSKLESKIAWFRSKKALKRNQARESTVEFNDKEKLRESETSIHDLCSGWARESQTTSCRSQKENANQRKKVVNLGRYISYFFHIQSVTLNCLS